jgi:transcriptional regulator with XRE-family HTH domain
MPVAGELNARVRLALCASRTSLYDAAEHMRVDVMSLSRIVTGERKITSLELALLADYLVVPVDYFLSNPGEEDDREEEAED